MHTAETLKPGFFQKEIKITFSKFFLASMIYLVLPIVIFFIGYILSNVLVFVGFVALFAIKEYFEIIWVFNIILCILFIFIASCFAYHVGLFCFVYSCSCQELIFPDNPLILHSESEDGQIEDVYSVFEEEDFYEK